MSVFYPILDIIVRKTPNSRRGNLTWYPAPTWFRKNRHSRLSEFSAGGMASDNTRTTITLVVPLVPEAVANLKNTPKVGKGDYILSSTEGDKPIRGIGKFYRTRLPREIIACNGSALSSPFTSHDLRRTVTRTADNPPATVAIDGHIRRIVGTFGTAHKCIAYLKSIHPGAGRPQVSRDCLQA
jgi:integrase